MSKKAKDSNPVLIFDADEVDIFSSDIATLAVIIMHADQLESKSTREFNSSRWVITEHFEEDFKNAQEITKNLLVLAMREFDGFIGVVESHENHLRCCVEECQEKIRDSNGGHLPESNEFEVMYLSDYLREEEERISSTFE